MKSNYLHIVKFIYTHTHTKNKSVGDTYSKKYTEAAFGEKAGARLQNNSAFK